MIRTLGRNNVRGKKVKNPVRQLHHAYSFAVRTDPGGAVADAPFIFFETVLADHEAARATPAELLGFFAAVADVVAAFPFPISLWGIFIFHCTSPQTQS